MVEPCKANQCRHLSRQHHKPTGGAPMWERKDVPNNLESRKRLEIGNFQLRYKSSTPNFRELGSPFFQSLSIHLDNIGCSEQFYHSESTFETGSLRNSIVFIIFNGKSVFNRFLGNGWSNLNVAINVRHLEHPEISYFNTKSLRSHKCIPGFHVQIGGFSYYIYLPLDLSHLI